MINLASRKGSDQVGLVGSDDTNNDVNAWVWDGNAFGSNTEITANAENPDEEQVAIAWESGSGNLIAAAAEPASTSFVFKEFTTGWSASATAVCADVNPIRWMSLKPNPLATANDMILAVGDSGSRLNTCYWDGTAWSTKVLHDSAIDFATSRVFDFAWEPTGINGLLVWGTTSGQITYSTFAAPSTWGAATDVPMGTNTQRWVQVRTNPIPTAGGTTIAGAVLDSNSDLGAIAWNGTGLAVISPSTFTANVGTTTYDSFDLEFRRLGNDRLSVRYDWTDVPPASSHTLTVKGYRGDEDVDVQVFTSLSSWTTRLTISATANTRYTYTLTAEEYNGGSPAIRFVDRGVGGSTLSNLWIDWAAIRPDGPPPTGTTASTTVRLEPGGLGSTLPDWLPNWFGGLGLKGIYGVIATFGIIAVLALTPLLVWRRFRGRKGQPKPEKKQKKRKEKEGEVEEQLQ